MGVWGDIGGDMSRIWGLTKTFALEDERAVRMRGFVTKQVNKVTPQIQAANAMGRDAMFTAKRTVQATSWDGRSLGYHALGGAGVGAALGAANAYGDGRDPVRGGIKGAFMGGVAGAGVGVGRSLYSGYGRQAASRLSGYGSAAGPMMGANPISRARSMGRSAGSFMRNTRTGSASTMSYRERVAQRMSGI